MKISELLSGPEKWTQGAWARNQKGETVSAFDSSACCWCISGAIAKCYPADQFTRICDQILRHLDYHLEEGSIFRWNDHLDRKFEEVKLVVETLAL